MKKNKCIPLIKGVHSIASLALALAPFTMANAGDGIATGTIDENNLFLASPGQQASFQALSQICIGSNFDASYACSLTGDGVFFAPNGGGGAAINNSLQLQQLSPQSAMQSESIAITSPYQFIRKVNQRLQERRESSDHPSERSESSNYSSGGGSSSDAYGFIGPFGISFSGGGGFGDRDNSVGQTGFQIDTRQANLMIDYTFNQKLIGGFAFNYLSTNRELGLESGTLYSDSYRFAPFLSYTPTSNSYITLMGGYALVDFDSTRKVSPTSPNINDDSFGNQLILPFLVSDAQANYNANEFFASLGAGYTHRMDAWSLRGYGRADYSHSSIESFLESGAQTFLLGDPIPLDDSYALAVDGQSILSVTSTLGAEISYALSTSTLAAVVIPKLHAEWVHEFENSGRTIQAKFNQFNVSTGPIAVAGPERNWANLGVGLQMLFPHAVVGYLNYDTLFIENASNQTVSGGVRVNF